MPNALDDFLKLEKEGKTDAEIVTALQEKGFSDQDINDAINQSSIKKAVNSPEGMEPSIMQQQPEQQEMDIPVPVPISGKKKRTQKEEAQDAQQAIVSPHTAEYQYAAAPQQQQAPMYDYSQQYQQPYSYGGGYSPQQASSQGVDVETIEEISEEIVNEKISEVRNKVEDLIDFKQSVSTRMNDSDERLKRIELNMDRLQAALISKVQEYSRNIKDLGSEMRAVEGAFSNILNPLVDNIKELNAITEKMKSKDKDKEKVKAKE